MAQYLQKRKTGGYLYRRRVPKDLRHRTDTFPHPHIEKYLGTSDKATAKRKAAVVNARWEQTFESMRRGEAATAEQLDRIKLAAQLQAYRTMTADPLKGPGQVQDDIEQFLPNVEADARRYLERAGLDPNDQGNQDEAQRAILIGVMGAQVFFERGLEPPDVPAYEPLTLDVAPDGPTVLQAAQAYMDAPDVSTTEKTRRQLLSSARLFAEHVGDKKPVAAVTGRDAVAWLDRLTKIDPNYRRDPKSGELTLAQLEEFYPAKEGQGLSSATLNRHAMHLRVLFSWLIKRHELPEEHRNPFAGKSRAVKPKVTRRAMTDSEIAALLDGAPLPMEQAKTFKQAVPWIVLVAAYSGMRAGEICALTAGDVEKREGVHVINVRQGKTAQAVRLIPVHPFLVECGFVEYAKGCEGTLFGATARELAKRFPPYRRSRGVGSAETPFHSLRHSFVTALERAGVSSDDVARLAGHKHLLSFSFGAYSKPSLARLAAAVAKVAYDLT